MLFINKINHLFKNKKIIKTKINDSFTKTKTINIKNIDKCYPPKLKEKRITKKKININFINAKETDRKLNLIDNSNLPVNNKSVNNSNIKINKEMNKAKNKKKENIGDNIEDINYKLNDYELNSLEYKEALKKDKRTYSQYYLSLLRMKHSLIFTFYTSNDFNSPIIKICFFLFSFSLYITINALFFTDSTIHKIYEDGGDFNFIYQIPQIIYSVIISSMINALLSYLSLTQKNILEMKKKEKKVNLELLKTIKCLKMKFIFFFIFSFIFLSLFWFFLGCFCCVFRNSQIHLIKDTMISYGLGLIYTLVINLVPGIFRITSLNARNKDRICIFKLSLVIQIL